MSNMAMLAEAGTTAVSVVGEASRALRGRLLELSSADKLKAIGARLLAGKLDPRRHRTHSRVPWPVSAPAIDVLARDDVRQLSPVGLLIGAMRPETWCPRVSAPKSPPVSAGP
jgi:hypothetical protein